MLTGRNRSSRHCYASNRRVWKHLKIAKHAAAAVSTDKPITEDSSDNSWGGERTGMQTNRAVAEMEFGLQERNNVTLNGEEIHEEPVHQVTIPSGATAVYHAASDRLSINLHLVQFLHDEPIEVSSIN